MSRNVNIVNKKAKFDYEFIRNETCGIVLTGTEVKSIFAGKLSLSESFCLFVDGELFIRNSNIPETDSPYTHKATKDRKLLLKKVELNRLKKELVKGLTIIPYRVFCNDKGLLKVEIFLCKGKNHANKKESLKEKDIKRDMEKELKIN
jgi:SsrA-binding protein